MGKTARNVLAVICAAVAAFAGAVALGLRLTPAPRTRLDYLVIGSVATFLMLGVIFGFSLSLWIRPRRLLPRRRRAGGEEPPDASGTGPDPVH